MREADFSTVDESIAHGLDEGEDVVVCRVEDDAFKGRLCVRVY